MNMYQSVIVSLLHYEQMMQRNTQQWEYIFPKNVVRHIGSVFWPGGESVQGYPTVVVCFTISMNLGLNKYELPHYDCLQKNFEIEPWDEMSLHSPIWYFGESWIQIQSRICSRWNEQIMRHYFLHPALNVSFLSMFLYSSVCLMELQQQLNFTIGDR